MPAVLEKGGFIVVRMESGAEQRFPVVDNPRLARGTPRQLNHIEISPFSLHWPELDEDLSFRGLIEGDHGQFQKRPKQQRADLECADMSALWSDATCRIKESGVKPPHSKTNNPRTRHPACRLLASCHEFSRHRRRGLHRLARLRKAPPRRPPRLGI
jgi:hypothetical protein